MKFEFNTEIDGPKEATALATALTVLYGGTIATALDNALQSLEDGPVTSDSVHPTDHVHLNLAQAIAEHEAAVAANEPSAAEAFGDQPQTPAPSGERDAFGIPWDARIHSGSKGTNKDGSWSRRRNTPDATFDAVMKELVEGKKDASAAEAFENPTPSEAPAPPVTDGSGETGATVGQTAPTVASPSSQVPPPPPPTTAAPISFPILMVKITKLQSAGKIDKATVDGFLNAFDMTEAKELAKAAPDTVAAINAMVDGYVGD